MCYSQGSFGGVRAAMQLRAMLGELGMPAISSIFPVPRIAGAFADDGAPLDPSWDRRFEKFAKELEWYANALRDARAKGVAVLKAGLKACTTTAADCRRLPTADCRLPTYLFGTMCWTDFSFSLQMNSMIWVSRMMRWFTRTLNGAV